VFPTAQNAVRSFQEDATALPTPGSYFFFFSKQRTNFRTKYFSYAIIFSKFRAINDISEYNPTYDEVETSLVVWDPVGGSAYPSLAPDVTTSPKPSRDPSSKPSSEPSSQPILMRSNFPSSAPSKEPKSDPSSKSSSEPSSEPSSAPSSLPSSLPSSVPSKDPFSSPSSMPFQSQASILVMFQYLGRRLFVVTFSFFVVNARYN